MYRNFTVITLLLALFACSAKEDPLKANRPQTVNVTGKVMYNGSPVVGAQVNFIPAANTDPAAYALTKEDGTFVLSTFEDEDGAVPGNYKVTVVKRSVETIPNPQDPSGPPVGTKAESFLPEKYGSLSSTDLQFDISNDGAESLEISLAD